MKNTTSSNPHTGVKVVASLLAASQVISAAESEEKVESLEPTTVIATKFEKNLSDVSNSVELLDVERLKREGQVGLQDSVGYRVPGVIAFSTAGQRGGSSSLLIRGTRPNKSQVRLDGVKISDSAIGSNFDFLGSSNLNGISNIEILKGAASAAYGAGAIGGVLSVDTAKGAGAPSSQIFAEYGSYNSWLGSLITQGEVDNFAYNLGITREDTQNDSDEPVSGNDFQQTSYFGRFDVALGQGSSLGLSVRGGEMYYENNANTYVNPLTKTPQKGNYDYEFTSLFLESQLSETWGTRLTLGFSEEDYEHVGYQEDFAGFPTYAPLGTYSENPFDKNTDRYSFYWDNEFVWTDSHTTVIGSYFENVNYRNPNVDEVNRDTYGFYANHSWSVTEAIKLNGVVGWDDHDDFGDEWTWNAGVVVNLTEKTRVKANAGEAFRAPSFDELFYPYYGNPELDAERSFNWDVSVEQSFDTVQLTATWFENDIENLIGFHPVTYINEQQSGKTKANGLEFSAEVNIDSLNADVIGTYTYYQNTPVSLVPQQTATISVDSSLSNACNVGLVATWVDKREAGADLEDYLLVRLYGNYQINESVKLHARVENLLDDDFRQYEGFGQSIKGRGRGFYGGVTVSF